jgi:membrane protease YdiL (CAAX protease family)
VLPEHKIEGTTSPQDALAMWEIFSVLTSCLIAEWVVFSVGEGSKSIAAIPVALAIVFMVLSHLERGETLREIGFRGDNFVAAARLLLLPTVLAIALILLGSWLFGGSAFLVKPFRPRFIFVPFWALFQQYALQGFINRRAQIVLGPGLKSIFLVAFLFSIVHLPNLLLTVTTFVGGLIWAAAYQGQPNLFALALSHSVASVTLALTVPRHLVDSLRVGFKYLV